MSLSTAPDHEHKPTREELIVEMKDTAHNLRQLGDRLERLVEDLQDEEP